MRIERLVRRGSGVCLVVALVCLLFGCVTTQQNGMKRSSRSQAANLVKTSIPDAELRASFPGTWVFERAALYRMEMDCSPDGRFTSTTVRTAPQGIARYADKGLWKIEDGLLVLTVRETNDKECKVVGVPMTNTIISMTGEEMVTAESDGTKNTLRRKKPANALVQDLYTKARLGEDLDSIRDQMLRWFEAQADASPPAQRNPPEVQNYLRNIMTAAFDTDRLAETLMRELEALMTAEELQAAIAWEDSPLGRKCAEVQSDLKGEEYERELDAYIVDLRQNPPPANRLKLAQEQDRSLKMTETHVAMVQNLDLAWVAGASAFLPPEQRPPLDQRTEQMEKERPRLIAMYEPLTIGGILYNSRSLSDAEFAERARFKVSEVGRKYYAAYHTALDRATLEALGRYWQALAETGKASGKTTGA